MNRHSQRGWRPPVINPLLHRIDPARLEVTCWCEEQTVYLPAQMIIAGQTVSCGNPWCNALEAVHAV